MIFNRIIHFFFLIKASFQFEFILVHGLNNLILYSFNFKFLYLIRIILKNSLYSISKESKSFNFST